MNRRFQGLVNGGAVKPRLSDHHKARFTGFALQERPVKIDIHPGTDRLKRQAHGFACYCGEAFQPQNVVVSDHRRDMACEGFCVLDLGQGDHKGLERIMIMIMMMVVVVIMMVVFAIMVMVIFVVVVMVVQFVTCSHISLGADPLPQKYIYRQRSHG